MLEYAVADQFDWDEFVELHWDRRPVHYRGVGVAPFDQTSTFRAAVGAAPVDVRLTLDQVRQSAPQPWLPVASDGSWDGYQRRMAVILPDRRHALMINRFHRFDRAMWNRERDFYSELWKRVGLPLDSAITTLFHGDYEHSPVGVHKDRFATFMFPLRGRKRMRFWADRPWSEPVSTQADYASYLEMSFAVDVEPGDVLYWPSRYYHVGETTGAATSINVGVAREEHLTAYEIDDIVAVSSADAVTSTAMPPQPRATVDPRRIAEVSLRRLTAAGFEPAPEPRSANMSLDGVVLQGNSRFPVRWTAVPDGCVCGVDGHTIYTPLPAETVAPVIAQLATGTRTNPAALVARARPDERTEIESLLNELVSRGVAIAAADG